MRAVQSGIAADGVEARQGAKNRAGRHTAVFAEAGESTRGVLELWAAVLLQAVDDYHRKGAGFEVAVNGIRLRGWYYDREMRRDKRRVEAWFKSDSEAPGGFRWICDILKLDPDRVWARVRQRDFTLTQ